MLFRFLRIVVSVPLRNVSVICPMCFCMSVTKSHIESVSLFMAACSSPSLVVFLYFSPPAKCGDEANL